MATLDALPPKAMTALINCVCHHAAPKRSTVRDLYNLAQTNQRWRKHIMEQLSGLDEMIIHGQEVFWRGTTPTWRLQLTPEWIPSVIRFFFLTYRQLTTFHLISWSANVNISSRRKLGHVFVWFLRGLTLLSFPKEAYFDNLRAHRFWRKLLTNNSHTLTATLNCYSLHALPYRLYTNGRLRIIESCANNDALTSVTYGSFMPASRHFPTNVYVTAQEQTGIPPWENTLLIKLTAHRKNTSFPEKSSIQPGFETTYDRFILGVQLNDTPVDSLYDLLHQLTCHLTRRFSDTPRRIIQYFFELTPSFVTAMEQMRTNTFVHQLFSWELGLRRFLMERRSSECPYHVQLSCRLHNAYRTVRTTFPAQANQFDEPLRALDYTSLLWMPYHRIWHRTISVEQHNYSIVLEMKSIQPLDQPPPRQTWQDRREHHVQRHLNASALLQ
jgi:hypothetical protein